MLLLELGRCPAVQSRKMDLGLLIERHVQLAACTEDEYRKILSFAEQAGYAARIKDLWGRCKRGTYTDNLFPTLFQKLKSISKDSKRPPFLGYWVNLIPSEPFLGEASTCSVYCHGETNTLNQFTPAGELERMAMNETSICLKANEEMQWMMPHHGIYVSGVSFHAELNADGQLQLFTAEDGRTWELLVDSTSLGVVKTTCKIPCRSKHCATWFKLCVRKGLYRNRLQIHGILQSV